MAVILDTNAVSAFFKGVSAVCDTVGQADTLAAPSIVLGEYRFGMSGSRHQSELEVKLGRLERLAAILSVDGTTARHYAAIRRELKTAGAPIPDNDLWIAALVRQHGLPLLSNDTHFDHVGEITRIDWR
jgi:tRNA(fMet)-specific endonuclease VapC